MAGADFQTGQATAGQTSGNARQDGPPAVQPVITTIKGETRVETGHLNRQPVDLAGWDIGRIAEDQVINPGRNIRIRKIPGCLLYTSDAADEE